MKKQDYIVIFLILAIIIGLSIYFKAAAQVNPHNKDSQSQLSNVDQTTLTSKTIKRHAPLNLSKDDTLISFRIDDITFAKSQKPVLENALTLARKYNITFDLAVIAEPFDEKADPETYQIFLYNQDVFEVVAHGLTHANPVNKSSKGEFYDYINEKSIPSEIQEEHIKKMREIFVKNNLTNYGAKIFLLPWSSGDQKTIELAEKYGYKLMTQRFIPVKGLEYNNEYLTVSKDWVSIDMNQTIKPDDIQKYKNGIHRLIKNKQTRIQIIYHPINFLKIENSDDLINKIITESSYNRHIKFSMISDGPEFGTSRVK